MKEIYILSKEERRKRAKIEAVVTLVFIGIFSLIWR